MKFDSYHPAINLLFFAAVLFLSALLNQPIFLLISYCASFAYSVKLNGKNAWIFNFALIPLIAVWALWYAYYHHFGITELSVNFIGNSITLESLVYGGVIGVIVAAILMWFSCIHSIVSTDKIMYLFGKISPKLSLFFAIFLRTIPQVKSRAKKISTAQQCIGRGCNQGNVFHRVRNAFRIFSIVITWTMESFTITSDSMRSRGYTLRWRTAYSIYRFDNRDRSFVITIFGCLSVILMGALLDQTRVQYNPEILVNRITPFSFVFYIAYFVLCLLPMSLQLMSEFRFRRLRKRHFPTAAA